MSKQHKIILIAGLSGVGKSYLISNLMSHDNKFVHFSAGTLIKKRLEVIERDELRRFDECEILKNQYLLLEQFHHELEKVEINKTILFDAHLIIDSDEGVVDIPFDIFEKLKPSVFIFLQEEPETIFNRRAKDHSRKRPVRSIEELKSHQDRSLSMATEYSSKLQVPFHCFCSSDIRGTFDKIN